MLGGGFGRKSKPDYAAEAAILSKAVGKPVKVVWSREDDIKFGYYHAVSAMYMKAALARKGRMPTAWLQRSVFPPIGSTFQLALNTYGDAGDLGQGWIDLPLRSFPIIRAENGPAESACPHRMVPLGREYLSRHSPVQIVRQRTRRQRFRTLNHVEVRCWSSSDPPKAH